MVSFLHFPPLRCTWTCWRTFWVSPHTVVVFPFRTRRSTHVGSIPSQFWSVSIACLAMWSSQVVSGPYPPVSSIVEALHSLPLHLSKSVVRPLSCPFACAIYFRNRFPVECRVHVVFDHALQPLARWMNSINHHIRSAVKHT
jgi:hypothetical protein